MACIVLKKLLGYELCILEKEGTLFYSDPIVIIRKESFTEIYNLKKIEKSFQWIYSNEKTFFHL